ncbi:MAG: ComEC/Rec2 family competence protein [Dermatophilaceae bacterium]
MTRPGPPAQTRAEPPADARLLGASCGAWAALAVTLSWSASSRLVLCALLLTGAAIGGWALAHRRARRQASRRGRHGGPERLPAVGLLVLGAVLLLQASATAHDLLQHLGPLDDLTDAGATVTLVGRVSTEPRRITSRFGSEEVLVSLDVVEVGGRGSQHPAHATVTLRGDAELAKVQWWSTIQVTGRLRPPPTPGPALADLRVRGSPTTLARPGLVARGAEQLRAGLRGASSGLPADARGLLPGLVIGDTSGLPPDLDAAMRATGMTHLTAVSGSNVAVVIALTLGLCALVGVPRRARPWVALLVLAGFVVLARPEPSVLRAAAMGAIGVIGLSRQHRAVGLPVLGGAVITVLVVDPWLARSYGFTLSTLAALGLLLFAGPWGEAMAGWLSTRTWLRMRTWSRRRSSSAGTQPRPGRRLHLLGAALAVPLAAQVACGPVIVLLQGSVSVVGVLANLLAAPLVPVATIGGVACAGVAVVSPTAAGWLAWLPGLPTLGIARVSRVLSAVPGGSIPWPDDARGAVLLAVLTVLALLLGRSVVLAVAAHPVIALAAVALSVAALLPTRVATWPAPGWRVVACDVGQGDALVLRSGPGRAVVVDAGPDPALVDGCLDRLDVTVVDALVLTHFHADHVDGVSGVGQGRDVRALLTTAVAEPPEQVDAVDRWARTRGLARHPVVEGELLHLGELSATVWGPVRRIEAGSVPNNSSVVLAVETGGARALLLGDIEREAGRALLGELRRRPDFAAQARSFDLVKAPHHGSANVDPDFLAAVRAPAAVISVGADNDYGHPAPSLLALLRQQGYATFRTDRDGDIALVSDASGVGIAVRDR